MFCLFMVACGGMTGAAWKWIEGIPQKEGKGYKRRRERKSGGIAEREWKEIVLEENSALERRILGAKRG